MLAATGVERPILIGHSDGGSISLVHAGSIGASSVRAVVLEAPHVFVERETVQAIASIRQDYDRTDLKRKLARHHEDVDGAFLGWTTVWLDPEFLEWNIEGYLPAVRCPVLAIQGDADAYGTVRQVEAVARGVAGRTEVVIFPGCGHSPHRERKRETLEAMARFIEEVLQQ